LKNILVTGGSGFIGGYVYRHFKDRGYNVKNFDIIGDKSDLNYIQGSISDFDLVNSAILENNIDIVFHFAGFSNINKVKDSPLECVYLNIIGATNFLEALRLNGNSSFVLASSVYVHDDAGHLYTTSKAAAERICDNYASLYGINSTIIRLGSVYGEHSRHEDVISIFASKFCSNEPICVHGDGEQQRNYIHGQDVAEACESIMVNNIHDEKLIIAGEKQNSLNDIISILLELDPSLDISYQPLEFRKDEYRGDVGDISATFDKLNWRPSINIYDGVKGLVNYFCSNKPN
jgi:UDP-glucose 4-epimerase